MRHAVRVRARFGQDVVVARHQPQGHAGPGAGVGVAPQLDGEPVAATPDGGGEVGLQHRLHGLGRVLGLAVVRPHRHRVQARRLHRVGRQRQDGAQTGVLAEAGQRGAAAPHHPGLVLVQLAHEIAFHRLAQRVLPRPGQQGALGEQHDAELDGRDVAAGQHDAGRLAARQQEHAVVEGQQGRAVAHGKRGRAFGLHDDPALAGQTLAQDGAGGGGQRQAGDADLVRFPGDGGIRDRRVEPHPVLRMEIVAAGGWNVEHDAGARRIGVRLRVHPEDQQSGGLVRVRQHPPVGGVVGRLGDGFGERLASLRRTPLRQQRLRGRDHGDGLVRRFVGGLVGLPRRIQRPARVGQGAFQLGLRQLQPQPGAGVRLPQPAFQRRGGGGPVATGGGKGGPRFRLAAAVRRAARGERLGQGGSELRTVGVQARKVEIGGATGAGEAGQQGGQACCTLRQAGHDRFPR